MAEHVAQAPPRREGRPLPDGDAAREWLAAMLLIRRFE
jgi:hypothetical protein